MADDSLKERADRRFESALAESGVHDPRGIYREWLRTLREGDADAYGRAADHYERRLLPAVAADGSDPLALWLEYGRFLATLVTEGETVQVDPSGKAEPYTPPVPPDHLVLHLPTATRGPALAVRLPAELSAAQQATHELLVKRMK